MRDWFARLSWPWVFVYFAVTFACGIWLFGLGEAYSFSTASILAPLGGGLFFSALMTPVTMLLRRRSPTTVQTSLAVSLALRTGQLPDSFDRAAWLIALGRRATNDRSATRLAIVVFALGVVLVVSSFGGHNLVGPVTIAAMLLAVGIWRVVDARIELPKIAQLETMIRLSPDRAHDAGQDSYQS